MSQAQNYAVLFSGGGRSLDNHSRYYHSLKQNYDLLLKRGVKAENILIAYAAGVKDSEKGLSPVYDSIVQWNEYANSVDNFYAKYDLTDSGFRDKFSALMNVLSSPENGQVDYADEGEKRALGSGDSSLAGSYIFSDNPSLIAFTESVNSAVQAVNGFSNQSNIDVKANYRIISPNELILNFEVYSKSDLSFATDNNSTVIAATRDSLQEAINGSSNPSSKSLLDKIDDNDSLYVWTFDHGSHTNTYGNGLVSKEFEGVNLATLSPWEGPAITSQDFANIFRGVTENAGMSTYAFAQCFAGGLLEALSIDPALANSNKWFGMSATNQYEVSNGTLFADGIAKGLSLGKNTGNSLFSTAFESYPEGKGIRSAIPNSWVDNTDKNQEHPWSHGYDNSGDRPIFVNDVALDGQDLDGLKLLDWSSMSDSLTTDVISRFTTNEDQPLDIFAEIRSQYGDLSPDLTLESYAPSSFGTLDYRESADSLIYTPLNDFHGQDRILLRFNDGSSSYEMDLYINVESVNDAPIAVDDVTRISSGVSDALIHVDDQPGFLDDTDVDGDTLSITSYSAPDNGTIEKVGDFLFEYQPNAGFVGSDSFLYVLSDGVAFDVAEVVINVVDSTL